MRNLTRSWEDMTSRERIVAMSLATGGVIAIINSSVWAVAVCYIIRQRALVKRAQAEAQARLAGSSPAQRAAITEGVTEGVMVEEA
jgi:hypothetical protein